MALADSLWKGRRREVLEKRATTLLAALCGREFWEACVEADAVFERVAATADVRLLRSMSPDSPAKSHSRPARSGPPAKTSIDRQLFLSRRAFHPSTSLSVRPQSACWRQSSHRRRDGPHPCQPEERVVMQHGCDGLDGMGPKCSAPRSPLEADPQRDSL